MKTLEHFLLVLFLIFPFHFLLVCYVHECTVEKWNALARAFIFKTEIEWQILAAWSNNNNNSTNHCRKLHFHFLTWTRIFDIFVCSLPLSLSSGKPFDSFLIHSHFSLVSTYYLLFFKRFITKILSQNIFHRFYIDIMIADHIPEYILLSTCERVRRLLFRTIIVDSTYRLYLKMYSYTHTYTLTES